MRWLLMVFVMQILLIGMEPGGIEPPYPEVEKLCQKKDPWARLLLHITSGPWLNPDGGLCLLSAVD